MANVKLPSEQDLEEVRKVTSDPGVHALVGLMLGEHQVWQPEPESTPDQERRV